MSNCINSIRVGNESVVSSRRDVVVGYSSTVVFIRVKEDKNKSKGN